MSCSQHFNFVNDYSSLNIILALFLMRPGRFFMISILHSSNDNDDNGGGSGDDDESENCNDNKLLI